MQKKIIVSKPVGFMILAWVVGLFLAVWISMMAAQASAQSSFSYQALAFLGDPVPGGAIVSFRSASLISQMESATPAIQLGGNPPVVCGEAIAAPWPSHHAN